MPLKLFKKTNVSNKHNRSETLYFSIDSPISIIYSWAYHEGISLQIGRQWKRADASELFKFYSNPNNANNSNNIE